MLATIGGVGGTIIGTLFGRGPRSPIYPFIAAVDPQWRVEQASVAHVAGWPTRSSDTLSTVPAIDLVLQFTNRGLGNRTVSELTLVVQRLAVLPSDTMASIGYRDLADSSWNPEVMLAPGESRRIGLRFYFPDGWTNEGLACLSRDSLLAGPMEILVVDALGAKRWTEWSRAARGRDRFFAKPLF